MKENTEIGTYRRFGDAGIVYQVLCKIDDHTVKIHVLETQEETGYPISDMLTDPKEA